MQATATRFAASWDLIRDSTTTSLADKVKAFQAYSQAATEANHGVETSEIAVQREMLRMQIIGQATGTSIVTSMGVGKDGVDKLLDSLRNVKPQPGLDGNNYNGNVSSPGDSNGPKYSGKRGEDGNDRPDGPSDRSGSTFLDSFGVERTRNSGAPVGTFTNTVPLDKAKAVANGVDKTKYTAADIPMLEEAHKQARNAAQFISATSAGTAGLVSPEAIRDTQGMLAATTNALDQARRVAAGDKRRADGQKAGPSDNKTLTINIGGRQTAVNLASGGDRDALTGIFRQLEAGAGTAQ